MDDQQRTAEPSQSQALPVAPMPSAFPDLPPSPSGGPSAFTGPA